LETYLIFDFSALAIILFSAFFAFFRGFSQELLSLASWITSFLTSYFFAANFINSLNKLINNVIISTFTSYVLVFILSLFILSFFTKKFSNSIKKSDVGMLDRTLGFIFGTIRGYVLVSLCLFSFHYFYDGDKIKWIESSKINFIVLITNSKFLDLMDTKGEYSKKLKREIDEKSNKLFEKSIDSHLKLKNHIDKKNKTYNENDRKSLDYLIENSEQ